MFFVLHCKDKTISPFGKIKLLKLLQNKTFVDINQEGSTILTRITGKRYNIFVFGTYAPA